MSSASAKAAEPSMEEILASIRRIIADDPDAASAEPPTADVTIVDLDAAETNPPALELTIADTASEPSAAVSDDTGARELRALPPLIDLDLEEVTFDQPAPVAEPASSAVEPPPPPPPAPPAEPFVPKPEAPFRPETLISTEATASIGHAFNMLSHTVLTQNARTLEDLVQDMLKPMLKTWLDDNLPPMVERLIRAEIERVARGR